MPRLALRLALPQASILPPQMSCGPGVSNTLLKLLLQLMLHAHTGKLSSEDFLAGNLTSALFWNVGASLYDMVTLGFCMPVRPAPCG